jgi:hypothetical protein
LHNNSSIPSSLTDLSRETKDFLTTKVLNVHLGTVDEKGSKKGNTLYTINYRADPSDYDTYLPGVQKIVDSFRMLVS